jgi:WD40 repeat protein/tetratricopeptide (TPR) repeat protein
MTIHFDDDFEFDLDFSSPDDDVDSPSDSLVEEYLTDKRLSQFTQDVFLPMPIGKDKTLAILRVKDLIKILQGSSDIEDLVDGVTSDAEFRWCLFIIVKLSSVMFEEFPEIALIASRAITILNYAYESFSAMQLQKIRIPDADLVNAMFDSTNMPSSDLTNVNSPSIWFRNANTMNSVLKKIQFKEYAGLTDADMFLASCAALDSSRQHMATTEGGSIFIWNIKTLAKIIVLQVHVSRILCIAFSKDNRIFVSGSEDGSICLWHIENKNSLVHTIEIKLKSQISINLSKKIKAVALSADNQWMAIGCGNNSIYLYNLTEDSSPKLRHTLAGHSGAINMLAFSAHDAQLASASEDCTIRLWQVTDENIQLSSTILAGHTHLPDSDSFIPDKKIGVSSIAFSSDRNKWLLASGGEDKTIRTWSLDDLSSPRQVLTGHEGAILSLEFSRNNQWLISASEDKTVHTWSQKEHGQFAKHAVIAGHGRSVLNASFGEQEKVILSVSHNRLLVSDIPNHSLGTELVGHKKDIACLVANEKGWAISGGKDNAVCVWRVIAGKKLQLCRTFRGHQETISSVALSHDASHFASTDGKTIRLYRIHDRRITEERIITHEKISQLTFHPNNAWLITASRKQVQLWDIFTGELLFENTVIDDGHFKSISCLAYRADGALLAVGGIVYDTAVQLWELNKNGLQLKHTLSEEKSGHDNSCTCLVFHPQMPILAVARRNNTVTLWDTSTGEKLLQHNTFGHDYESGLNQDGVVSITFNEDGSLLFASTNGGTNGTPVIRAWDINSGNCVSVISTIEHRGNILLSFQKNRLITGNTDGAIHLLMPHKINNKTQWVVLSRSAPYHLFVKDLIIDAAAELSAENRNLLLQHGAAYKPATEQIDDCEANSDFALSLKGKRIGECEASIALEHIYKKEYMHAIDIFSGTLQFYPGHKPSYLYSAHCHHFLALKTQAEEHLFQAEHYFRMAIAAPPQEISTVVEFATFLYQQKRFEECLNILTSLHANAEITEAGTLSYPLFQAIPGFSKEMESVIILFDHNPGVLAFILKITCMGELKQVASKDFILDLETTMRGAIAESFDEERQSICEDAIRNIMAMTYSSSATLYMGEGNFVLAIEFFEKSKSIDPSFELVFHNLACCYHNLGVQTENFELIFRAEENFTLAMNYFPSAMNTKVEYANFLFQQERYSDCTTLLEDELLSKPFRCSQEDLKGLGGLSYSLHEIIILPDELQQEVIDSSGRLEINRPDIFGLYLIAYCAFRMRLSIDSSTKVASSFEGLINSITTPLDKIFYKMLYYSYWRIGDEANATRVLNKLHALQENTGGSVTVSGSGGKHPVTFESVIDRKRAFASMLNRSGNYQLAISFFLEQAKANPDDVWHIRNCAKCYHLLGITSSLPHAIQQAEQHFLLCIERSPTTLDVQVEYAIFLFQQNKRGKCLSILEQVLEASAPNCINQVFGDFIYCMPLDAHVFSAIPALAEIIQNHHSVIVIPDPYIFTCFLKICCLAMMSSAIPNKAIQDLTDAIKIATDQQNAEYVEVYEFYNMLQQYVASLSTAENLQDDWQQNCHVLYAHGYRFFMKIQENSLKIGKLASHSEDATKSSLLANTRQGCCFFASSDLGLQPTDIKADEFTLAGGDSAARDTALCILSEVSSEVTPEDATDNFCRVS